MAGKILPILAFPIHRSKPQQISKERWARYIQMQVLLDSIKGQLESLERACERERHAINLALLEGASIEGGGRLTPSERTVVIPEQRSGCG